MSQDPLRSICYDSVTAFTLLDQRVLPHTVRYDDVKTLEDVFVAIKEMRVRGAPAIAVAAALGVAVAANTKAPELATVADAKAYLDESLDYMAQSRPTAVNLFNAIRDLKAAVAAAAPTSASAVALVATYVAAAEQMLRDDTALNEGIMKCGAKDMLATCGDKAKLRVMTVCNTGALATTRYGTALGCIRQLHYDGRLEQVYALETRPWNQGARLTVFECCHEKIPVTLVVDGAVSFTMKRFGVDAVVVGADRVCANGDTANKIGTYALAVAAKHHGVPFYVAAPTTTLDARTPTGAEVEIEERTPTEITHNVATGQRVVAESEVLTVWNPVFDITPAELITGGIITERGVLKPAAAAPFFDIAAAVAAAQ